MQIPDKYRKVEKYMNKCMSGVHDSEHARRVLFYALDIAATEPDADIDIVVIASLLHDIGRMAQTKDKKVNHAEEGALMARKWLLKEGYPKEFADAVAECIATHRFRSGNEPKTLEAKIVFDADKVDTTGAIGIARAIAYGGEEHEPLYLLDENGQVSDGKSDKENSLMKESWKKIRVIGDRFLTKRGKELGLERAEIAQRTIDAIIAEARACYANAEEALKKLI
ncbi:MAG: HD domain-containing protein [Clostridiales bacterium]|jgi:uncharacterized protein|nr:HD domain-containing protein [Clostridiales bacterium]